MYIMIDFADGLPAEMQLWIHRSKLCKRYLAERARVGTLAADHYAKTGTLCDPALRAEIAGVEALGRELQKKIRTQMQRRTPSSR